MDAACDLRRHLLRRQRHPVRHDGRLLPHPGRGALPIECREGWKRRHAEGWSYKGTDPIGADMMVKSVGLGAMAVVLLLLMSPGFDANPALHAQTTAVGAADQVPEYVFDPTWPKMPLRGNWVTGPVVGVATDAKDHIWVVHRERAALSATQRDCCPAAPAVLGVYQA